MPTVSPLPMAAAIWLSAASICRRTASRSGAAGVETTAEVVSLAGGSFVGVHAASSAIGTAAIASEGRDMARLQCGWRKPAEVGTAYRLRDGAARPTLAPRATPVNLAMSPH